MGPARKTRRDAGLSAQVGYMTRKADVCVRFLFTWSRISYMIRFISLSLSGSIPLSLFLPLPSFHPLLVFNTS